MNAVYLLFVGDYDNSDHILEYSYDNCRYTKLIGRLYQKTIPVYSRLKNFQKDCSK